MIRLFTVNIIKSMIAKLPFLFRCQVKIGGQAEEGQVRVRINFVNRKCDIRPSTTETPHILHYV